MISGCNIEKKAEIAAIKSRLLNITASLANDSKYKRETAVEGLVEVINELDEIEPRLNR